MGLFGRKQPPARPGRVLAASGMRIQAGNPETIRALAASRQSWQADAWHYRNQIGELRFANQFLARAVSRVKYFAAESQPGEDEPIPLDAEKGVTVSSAIRKAAAMHMARLPLDAGYGFLGIGSENLSLTGETWLHGFERDGEERWEFLSVSEVVPGSDGTVSIRPYGQAMASVVGDDEEMLRFWVPNPEFKILADSPMRAVLNVCEEIILIGREMRAASRSRFAANGLLLVPQGLTLLNALKEDGTLVENNEFMASLAAVLLAPIANEGDPGAVVPAMITGDKEDLDGLRHLRMEREDSEKLLEKRDSGLSRLARGLDIPPEIITGMAQANHWTAWQIDASTYRHHIDPAVRIMADSMAEGYLQPALIADGFDRPEVRKIQVGYDAGSITENPNRGQDAKDAFDRGGIGFEPLRQALGFSKADAPDDEEMLQMVAYKIGLDTATSAQLLQAFFGKGQPIQVQGPAAPEQPAEPAQLPPAPAGPADAQPGTGDDATPVSPGAARILSIIAAATKAEAEPEPGWILDAIHGRDLMEIDRTTRDKLLVATDAALLKALEKAGARIKSKAQKNADSRKAVLSVATIEVGAVLGRDAVLALGTDEHALLADALDGLEEKFAGWTEAAIERSISVVLALLRLKADSTRGKSVAKRLRDGMNGRVKSGWGILRDGLMSLAEQYLFNPHPVDEPGEAKEGLVPPALVRGALAHVGGLSPETGGIDDDGKPVKTARPVGGIGLGSEVETVLASEGVEELGFEWVYGITMKPHQFEPHKDLEGERLSSWKDPKLIPPVGYEWLGDLMTPGDHNGCMCDYAPAYALKEYAEAVADKVAPESENARNDRILAEMDDAAGRKGTTAQQQRDQRQAILTLQDRFIQEGSRS